ncbi:autotransporter outer membrane beta-barrel domain-containing protein [Yersinia sp. 2545 StPb PI]|uniref:autotransporter outer membrane beta-barrel domain-containing protein n=1 Tax=Yersinia sp. 2545 StPb PI TaxID=3117410 RepID=UPI003FA41F07
MLKLTRCPHPSDTRRRKFLLSTLSTVILCSMAGMAHAGSCTGSLGVYTCSGVQDSVTDSTQYLSGSPLSVTTEPNFGIVTSSDEAFNLNGTDGLSFTDDNGSTITGQEDGILARNDGAGVLSITTTGTVTGTNQFGIMATNDGTDLTIEAADVFGDGAGIYAINRGTGVTSITTTGTVSGYQSGILARNDGSGALSITSTGTATGTDGYGISTTNLGTDLTIHATDVFGGDAGILAINSGTGALSITSTGTATGTDESGIYAINLGTDLTIQAADVSGNVGILAENRGAGVTSITTTGTVTGRGMQGIQAINTGLGPVSVEVNTGSTVQGALTGIDVNSTTPIDITNAGTVRNLSGSASDIAIQTSGAQGTLTNSGLLQGTVQLSDEGNRVINNAGGSWVTAGGTNEFGALTASNSLVNNGTLIAANGSVTDPVQTTTFNNVGTFTNASTGILNMDNGRAGDVTIINGDYVGNGGSLLLNTVLADDASVTDKLVVNGSTAGTTYVGVNNLGGSGAATLNGIELIQVSGVSDGEFVKNGRIVAGAYDYLLVRGADTNASNWYLTSVITPTPTPEPTPPTLLQRPEAGSYTANLAAVNNMFVTTLHDRLGETQYIDALTGEQKVTSLWLRNEGGHNRSRDTSGQLSTQANRYVVQLGGDIAQWSNNDRDRFHLGLMAGYGNSKSTTVSSLSGYNAKGSTDGYSTGIYGTWYANDADKSGLYVDSWAQYSWFNNTVDGQDLASEEYKSKGVTASVESGYTFKVGENAAKNATYFIQPKAQVTWMGVKADDHKEANGTNVSGEGDGNIQTRLGVKAFMKGYSDQDKGKDRVFQPFVEANWVHNTNDFGTTMDSVTVKQDGAANIAELKVGVEGQLNKQVNLWGNVGQQVGNKGYSDTAVMLGVKYNF